MRQINRGALQCLGREKTQLAEVRKAERCQCARHMVEETALFVHGAVINFNESD